MDKRMAPSNQRLNLLGEFETVPTWGHERLNLAAEGLSLGTPTFGYIAKGAKIAEKIWDSAQRVPVNTTCLKLPWGHRTAQKNALAMRVAEGTQKRLRKMRVGERDNRTNTELARRLCRSK